MKRALFLGLMLVTITATGAFAQAPEGRRGGGQGGGGRRGPAAPACTTFACDVQNQFDRGREQIIAIADAMPEDKWDFKPTPAQQTFGERVMHIVQVDQGLLGSLGGKTPKPAINLQAKTKADVMTALRQSFDWAVAVTKEFNDQQLLERVMSMPFLGPTTSRANVLLFDVGHTQDIYGQLVVYLRLNGITPPASRRGSV
jgi:uncharacterized damage-inducible protein DinB